MSGLLISEKGGRDHIPPFDVEVEGEDHYVVQSQLHYRSVSLASKARIAS